MKKHIFFFALLTILFAFNTPLVRDFFYHIKHHVLAESPVEVEIDGQWYYAEFNNGYFVADIPGEKGKVVYIHESLVKRYAPCRFCQDEAVNFPNPNIKYGVGITDKNKIIHNSTDKFVKK